MEDKEEGALSRWSRLKREAASAAREEPESGAVGEETAAPGEPEPDVDAAIEADADEEAVCIEDLPDIETLDYESDFSVFMRAGVPEELRKLALRKLWRSSPVLANLDGLNDYDWDFRKGWSLGDTVRAVTPEVADLSAMPAKPETVPGRRDFRGPPDARAGAPGGPTDVAKAADDEAVKTVDTEEEPTSATKPS